MTITIAIDGAAASGKGTLARRIAEALGFVHLDTGALYRAVAKRVIDQGEEPDNERAARKAAQWLQDNVNNDVLHDCALRTDEIGSAASKVAAFPSVRKALLDLQRSFAQAPGGDYEGAILDGRDIGTVICPKADIKLFLEATIETRADRRTKELQSKGIEATYEAVLRDMRERDERDASRQTAPLTCAKDAIVLDTSDLGPDEIFEHTLEIIQDHISS